MSVHYDSLAGDHGQNVAFRAHRGAGSAANAIVGVDVRMLSFRAVREKLAFLHRFARPLFSLLQVPQVDDDEEDGDASRNRECDQRVHRVTQKYPNTNCNPMCITASTAKA